MTTVVSGPGGTTTVTDLSKAADEQAALARSRRVDDARKMCYGTGAAQVALGVLGLVMSFGWFSAIFTIAQGGIALGAWRSLPDAMRYFDQNRSGCCDPTHTKGLAIAAIVFAVLEMISFGAAAPLGLLFIAVANIEVTDSTTGTTASVPLAPRAALTYIGLCIVAAVAFAIINLILAIVQICFTDALMNAGHNGRVLATSASTVTVVMPHQQQPYGHHPYAPYPQQQMQGPSPSSMYVSPHHAAYAPYPQQHGMPMGTSPYQQQPQGYHPQPGYGGPAGAPGMPPMGMGGPASGDPQQQQPQQQQPQQQQPQGPGAPMGTVNPYQVGVSMSGGGAPKDPA